MNGRAAQMARIAALRSLQERACEAASLRAMALVRAAEGAIEDAEAAMRAAAAEQMSAIADSDRHAWLLADAMREVAGWNRAQLRAVKVGRDAEADARRLSLIESRRRREQSECVVTELRCALALGEQRTEQARSDDRFAARRHWDEQQVSRIR